MVTTHPANRGLIAGWVLLFISISMLSAANGYPWSYGQIKSNPATDEAFDSHRVPMNYNYYYFGRSNMPYAIVGLDPQYNLESRLWRRVDAGTAEFKQMVEWTWWDTYNYPDTPQGKDILDPEGRKIGIWYSSARWAAVKMLDDRGSVMIAPDTPWHRGGF